MTLRYSTNRGRINSPDAKRRPSSERRRGGAVACVVGALLVTLGCSSSGADGEWVLGRQRAAVVDGAVDQEHDAVLAIVSATRRTVGLCTGTLIAPNLVLTAQHCVTRVSEETVDCAAEQSATLLNPRTLGVTSNGDVFGSANFEPVAEILLADPARLCGADIALLVLSNNVGDQTIAPRLDAPPRSGETLTVVGYGQGLEEEAGLRRVRDDLQVLCDAEQCGAPGSVLTTEFLSDGGVCSGDSGGPALDTSGQVIGVASRGSEACDLSIYSSVSGWRDWIVENAVRAQERGNYAAPDWLKAALAADLAPAAEPSRDSAVTDTPSVAMTVPSGETETPNAVEETPPVPAAVGDVRVTEGNAGSGCQVGTSRSGGTPAWAILGLLTGIGAFFQRRAARPVRIS